MKLKPYERSQQHVRHGIEMVTHGLNVGLEIRDSSGDELLLRLVDGSEGVDLGDALSLGQCR